jgi:predicted DNA-binding ribbon-helix-helix protein
MQMSEAQVSAPTDASVAKRSIVIAGHRTSISLEDAFWQALKTTAAARQISLASLVTQIDATRGTANLSSAIRVFVLRNMQDVLEAAQ